MDGSWIERLAASSGHEWKTIREARAMTRRLVDGLRVSVARFDDPYYAIVVTGALGRWRRWFSFIVDVLTNSGVIETPCSSS